MGNNWMLRGSHHLFWWCWFDSSSLIMLDLYPQKDSRIQVLVRCYMFYGLRFSIKSMLPKITLVVSCLNTKLVLNDQSEPPEFPYSTNKKQIEHLFGSRAFWLGSICKLYFEHTWWNRLEIRTKVVFLTMDIFVGCQTYHVSHFLNLFPCDVLRDLPYLQEP